MLIGFTFKNFRSYLKEQAFTFAASADNAHRETNCVRTSIKSTPQLSKAAIVFGSNASGKTNFIEALETMCNLVLNSTAFTSNQFAGHYTPHWSCSAGEPTTFEIELLIERVRYRYSFSYDSTHISYERLLVFTSVKSQRWFERRSSESDSSGEWELFSSSFYGPREMWRKATRPAALFLTTGAQLNSKQLQPIYQWFERHLEFLHPSRSTGVGQVVPRLNERGFKARMLQHLNSVGIRVSDVRLTAPELRPASGDSHLAGAAAQFGKVSDKTKIEFLYALGETEAAWRRFEHESSGAHRLFGLFGHLFATLDEAKLLVIDDFDLNLHSLVAFRLIKLVNNPASPRAQLILVSHNTALMDLSLFRRDEIWLTEIDEMNGSNLYQVSRSSPRRREQIAKGYLRGRYGSIPKIHEAGL